MSDNVSEETTTVTWAYSKDEVAGILMQYVCARDGIEAESADFSIAYTCGRVRTKEKQHPVSTFQFYKKKVMPSSEEPSGFKVLAEPLDPAEVDEAVRKFIQDNGYDVQNIGYKVTGEQGTSFDGIDVTVSPVKEKTM